MDLENLQHKIISVIAPLKPADQNTRPGPNNFRQTYRSEAGRSLPPYFLIYFLFNDLLKFQNVGREEKVAWSFPIDFNGKLFLIDHRKFGFGIFLIDREKDEADAAVIAHKIRYAVSIARPFFDHIAKEAVAASKLNISNLCSELFNRYRYFIILHYKITKRLNRELPKDRVEFRNIERQKWLALSAIDAFFAWTEHLFIHLAVIARFINDGNVVTDLIKASWDVKYKRAITLADPDSIKLFNELVALKNQVRNFVTHGAFGKDMQAFSFHSKAGAVPVQINYDKNKNFFSISGATFFDEVKALALIERFIQFLWASELAPAMEYTQKNGLPTILTMAKEGFYQTSMVSMEKMKEFILHLMREIDNAANMDW